MLSRQNVIKAKCYQGKTLLGKLKQGKMLPRQNVTRQSVTRQNVTEPSGVSFFQTFSLNLVLGNLLQLYLQTSVS